MRKSQDVLGLPVISIGSGKEMGVVRDLLFDNRQHLFGLLLESKGWTKRRRYIPAERIVSFGLDAVTVDSEEAVRSLAADHDEVVGVCSGRRRLKGLPVMTTTGDELGRLENVYFMEEVGTLVGYELTEGFLSDMREGRKTLHSDENLTWGDDALIIPGNATPELMSAAERK